MCVKNKDEKQSILILWERWFGAMHFNIYTKELPILTFQGSCVTDGFPWDDYDKQKKSLIGSVIYYPHMKYTLMLKQVF
jgi:hypothetical protein